MSTKTWVTSASMVAPAGAAATGAGAGATAGGGLAVDISGTTGIVAAGTLPSSAMMSAMPATERKRSRGSVFITSGGGSA